VAKHDTAKTDLDRLQGVWSVVSIEQQGGKPSKLNKAAFFMVDGKRACWQISGSDEMQGGLYLDPTSKPKTYDLAMSTRTIEGIYSLEGDTLRLCYDLGTESKRPGGFITEKGSQQFLLVLKRTHGPEVFPCRLPDGTRAFPTVIEKKAKTPPPQEAPTPKDGNKYGFGFTTPGSEEPPASKNRQQDFPVKATEGKRITVESEEQKKLQGTWAYTGRGWQGNVTEQQLRKYPDEKLGRLTFSDGECAWEREIDKDTSQVSRLNYTLETRDGSKWIVFQLRNPDPRMPPIPKSALMQKYSIQGDKLTFSCLVHPVAKRSGDPEPAVRPDDPEAVFLHAYFKRQVPAPKTRK